MNDTDQQDDGKPTLEDIQNEIERLGLDIKSNEFLKDELARLSLENKILNSQVKMMLDNCKKFVLRLIAVSKGKLDLSSMVISDIKNGELNQYELGFIKAIESAKGRKHRKKQLKDDIKQKEKEFVKECWEAWQIEPSQYKNNTKFAQAMIDKFRPENPDDESKHLNSVAVITDWCREWKKEKSQSAS